MCFFAFSIYLLSKLSGLICLLFFHVLIPAKTEPHENHPKVIYKSILKASLQCLPKCFRYLQLLIHLQLEHRPKRFCRGKLSRKELERCTRGDDPCKAEEMFVVHVVEHFF